MLSHGRQDKTRHRHIPKFHKNSLWQHADLDDHDQDQDTTSFCFRDLEQRMFQARPFRFRDPSPDDNVVQFRKLILPSSDSYDGSAELSSQHLPRTSTNESFQSQSSDTSVWICATGWNVPKLLELSDTIRAALNDGRDARPTELGDLTFVLGMMIADEMDDARQSKGQRASQKVDLTIVQRARLDKLLADMLLADEKGAYMKSKSRSEAAALWPEIEIARSLQKYWRSRFKNEYFALDKRRCDDLIAGGLRDMLFSNVSGGQEDWSYETVGLSEKEGIAHFLPGQWWFNLECAHRDGIVGASVERLTTGRHGIAALPLLTGWEEDLPDGRTEYIRRGGQRDMHYGLLRQVGRRTKVIRGFRLKSAYAPQAGIRYDGLYNLTSWSIKLCPCTDLYTLKVILERLPRQRPMREVLQVPKPSQLDDWVSYEKLEKESIKQREGAIKLLDWTTAREKERAERDYWRQLQVFRVDMRKNSEAGGGSDPPSPRQTQWPHRSKKPDIGSDLGTSEWPKGEEGG
ncbi:hypothetical protein VMCG_00306 [Cytospora schulzeri]|uniref:YDG domain-containing protein n=1 Tax=Cytospora schulzeri TaxID=448051 RepID=A0A423X8L4_9PEZI|nr:hypothetical protein VMCG_00306 [Valsa malicola]